MTKTDWTIEQMKVIAQIESAVPVVWVDPDDVAEKRGAVMGTADPYEHEGTRYKLPLYTHPPAQPAQEQPGWEVPMGELVGTLIVVEDTSSQYGVSALFAYHDNCGGLAVGEHDCYVLASPTPPKEK